MSILEPAALAFAATLPLVVALYLLKRKRVVTLVSSTLLWQKYLAETQANAPFQKLRKHWLLLLQLLLLALAILALSRPYRSGFELSKHLQVVILDGSASMQATDEAPSRFDKARAEALLLVDALKDHDQMMVVVAGGATEVRQSPTSDKVALRAALRSAAAMDVPTRLVDAFKLAESLVKNQASVVNMEAGEQVADAEIHLFSDGAFKELPDLQNKNLPVTFHRIGVRSNNLGIVSMDVRPNPDDPSQRALFVAIANSGPEEMSTNLELRFEDQVLEVRPISVPPTNVVSSVFVTKQSADGLFEVVLSGSDDLAVDNRARLISLLPKPPRIVVVTRGNRFLEKGLRSAGAVDLELRSTLPGSLEGVDVVVLDDVPLTDWPSKSMLSFRSAPGEWFPAVKEVREPAIVDWRHTDPVLRSVSFDSVYIQSAIGVSLPAWGTSLVEAKEGPLIVAGEIQRNRVIWVGFDVLQTNWPLQIGFPIFLANALEWLNPTATGKDRRVKAGEAIRFPVNEGDTAMVVRPDGSEATWGPIPGVREGAFAETSLTGLYQVTAGTNSLGFAVNLLDPQESNIAPKGEIVLGKNVSVSAQQATRAQIEYWRWVAGLVCAALMWEWWYFHRRTA